MKQHITKSQWHELIDKQKQAWIDWQDRDIQSDKRNITGIQAIVDDSYFYQIIDIGQMIEFLDEHSTEDELMIITNGMEALAGGKNGVWKVGSGKENKMITDAKFHKSKILCDALWEAVKEILENKEISPGDEPLK